MTLRLSLFGAPTVVSGDQASALAFERRGQLLVYLALRRGWVGRAELAALLWPEQESKLAYTNLRKALFRLQSFQWGARVESNGSALRFEVPTDVASFEGALREGRLAEAIELRRGDLLAGFDDHANEAWSSWLGFERDRLRVAWRAAARDLLAGDIDPHVAVGLAMRLLDEDPLDETALGSCMSWLSRTGQGARARQAYRDFAARLSSELGLTPNADLKALNDSIGVAPLHPAGALRTEVAPPDDGFVGRAVELRRIAGLLAEDTCRLLTITGPGGVGKTRLVRRALAEQAPRFADGAVFVPLEDSASAGGFVRALAHALDVKLTGGGDALDPVLAFLRERRMLLALDNFEQLVEAAPVVDRLLAGCPGVKLLVTSRIRLALAGEWLLPLDGLPCPEAEDQDRLEAFDAARLFLRAARRFEPALVAAVEAPAIVDICRQVDGLPLALELAAAWTRVLSCDAIAAELRQGAELLHAVDPTQPARHASIEVVFDQSWRLLTDGEREALARLSVFRGGFTAEAARAVAGAALPVLGALADKSLLRKDSPRLYLHPLVQQLAADRLARGTGAETTYRAHAAYFHRLLVQLKSAVADGARTALQSIDDDFENCRRAWLWSVAQDQAGALASSVVTLLDYCDYRGRFEDGAGMLRRALDAPGVQADPKVEALLLSRLSHMEYRLDRYGEAEAYAQRALARTRRGRDREARRQAVTVIAACALRLGRLDDARSYFKQALEETPPEEEAHSLAVTLDHLALVEKRMGNFDESLRLSLQSLAQHRSLGDVAGVALCLSNLGALYFSRHEYDSAMACLTEARSICESAGIFSTLTFVLANLTEVATARGDLAAAEAHAIRGIEVARSMGNRSVVAWMTINNASLAVKRGNLAAARSSLADGLRLALEIRLHSLKFDAVVCLAEILRAQGEDVCARQVMLFAAGHPTADLGTSREIQGRLGAWPASTAAVPAWAVGMDLDELAQRIVAESSVAYAPLIAALHSTH